MDNIQRTALFGSAPETLATADTSAGASAGRPLAAAAWFRAVGIVDELEATRELIEGDVELSRSGKDKKLSRACRDAQAALGKIAEHRDTLAAELEGARKRCRPEGEPDPTVNAAIWPKLPDEEISMATTYRDAVERQDWATCDAIETLPSVFDGSLTPDEVAALVRDRMAVQSPDALKAADLAAEIHGAVDVALGHAIGFVEDMARPLPDPADGGEAQVGDDGLRILSASQFAEATG